MNAAAQQQSPDERERLFTEIAQLREERADLMREVAELREELRRARLEDQS